MNRFTSAMPMIAAIVMSFAPVALAQGVPSNLQGIDWQASPNKWRPQGSGGGSRTDEKGPPLRQVTDEEMAPRDWTQIDPNLTDLRGRDLGGGNYSSRSFMGADLSGADLSGANVTRADFSGANLVERASRASHALNT